MESVYKIVRKALDIDHVQLIVVSQNDRIPGSELEIAKMFDSFVGIYFCLLLVFY